MADKLKEYKQKFLALDKEASEELFEADMIEYYDFIQLHLYELVDKEEDEEF